MINLLKPGAWIITGGLNRGVDRLIGNEVMQKPANKDKTVLGISNWGCLEDRELLLNVMYSIFFLRSQPGK